MLSLPQMSTRVSPLLGLSTPGGLTPQAAPWELPSLTRKLDIDGLTIYATLALAQGRPHTLMLACSKQGSLAHGLLGLLGATASLALQEGVPLSKLCAQWRRTAFDPSGFTRDSQFPLVSSPMDAVAQWLETLETRPENARA